MAPDIIALESVSITSALSSTLTIYPCQIRADSLKLQLLTARKEWWPTNSRQFTPGGYLPAVIHTMGIEPTTFLLLIRRATSRATRPWIF